MIGFLEFMLWLGHFFLPNTYFSRLGSRLVGLIRSLSAALILAYQLNGTRKRLVLPSRQNLGAAVGRERRVPVVRVYNRLC